MMIFLNKKIHFIKLWNKQTRNGGEPSDEDSEEESEEENKKEEHVYEMRRSLRDSFLIGSGMNPPSTMLTRLTKLEQRVADMTAVEMRKEIRTIIKDLKVDATLIQENAIDNEKKAVTSRAHELGLAATAINRWKTQVSKQQQIDNSRFQKAVKKVIFENACVKSSTAKQDNV